MDDVTQSPGAGRPRAGRKPGRKPMFTREDAVRAVLDEGIDSFTMGAVARRLGVAPGALYRAFESREDLQRAALNHCASFLEPVARSADTWQGILIETSRAMWKALVTYRELATVLASRPQATHSAMPYLAQIVRAITQCGIPGGEASAAFALDFIGDTTLMTFIQMQPYHRGEAGVAELTDYLTGAPDRDIFGMTDLPSDGYLQQKIAFILRGIEAGLVDLPARSSQRDERAEP